MAPPTTGQNWRIRPLTPRSNHVPTPSVAQVLAQCLCSRLLLSNRASGIAAASVPPAQQRKRNGLLGGRPPTLRAELMPFGGRCHGRRRHDRRRRRVHPTSCRRRRRRRRHCCRRQPSQRGCCCRRRCRRCHPGCHQLHGTRASARYHIHSQFDATQDSAKETSRLEYIRLPPQLQATPRPQTAAPDKSDGTSPHESTQKAHHRYCPRARGRARWASSC